MNSNKCTLSEVGTGQTVQIHEYQEGIVGNRLVSMGFAPGQSLQVVRRNRLGGALYVQVQDRMLALRRDEAAQVIVSIT